MSYNIDPLFTAEEKNIKKNKKTNDTQNAIFMADSSIYAGLTENMTAAMRRYGLIGSIGIDIGGNDDE